MTSIFEPLPLKHGGPLPNRLAKAAMEEQLGTENMLPSQGIFNLYRTWARGGVGLIITGNVMVDYRAVTNGDGIILNEDSLLEPFQEWATAAHANGTTDTKVWMQINHPGRQVPASLPGIKLAPSAIPVNMGAHSKIFATPIAMTEEQIEEVIGMFVTTATRAIESGFDGVQVHAAHGYLLSQFLSPLVNRRTDRWGGDLKNRSRLLREIITRIRAAVPDSAAVAVKLNSADFQRGGFDVDDATAVVRMLGDLGVDLVEVSGGTYESPAMQGMQGVAKDQRTLDREAYFLTFAEQIAQVAPMPIMVTGGITRRATAERVLATEVDMVGMGTALSVDPGLPNTWRVREATAPTMPTPRFKDKAINSYASLVQVQHQLHRLSKGKRPFPKAPLAMVLATAQIRDRQSQKHYRKWLEAAGWL